MMANERYTKTRSRKKLIVLAALFAVMASGSGAAQSSVILGVLEEGPGDEYGHPNTRNVRVVFKKVGSEWQPYPCDCRDEVCLKSATSSYPREVTWTIAFDSKNLGQVTSRTPDGFSTYWRVGQQEIASKSPVPTIGKRSAEFGGFLDAEVHRPLMAVSHPNFRDPDLWKPAVVAPEVLRAVRRQFRQKFPRLCRSKADETDLLSFAYSDEDLKPAKSYSSGTGWDLVRVHLDGAIACEDTEAGFEIPDAWFLVDSKGVARYLDSGMFLVDAGDYDADGKSELVFSIYGYDRGGYRIYYDNFKKSAEFKFGYH